MRRARLVALLLVAAGCELSEVTIAQPERAVVAEAYVRLGVRQAGGTRPSPTPLISVLLHETLDATGKSGPVEGARIRVTRASDGLVLPVALVPFAEFGDCTITIPADGSASCYVTPLDTPGLESLLGGDRLSLRIELAAGGVLTSETVIPGRYELLNVIDGSTCAIAPRTGTGIVWSPSATAWAYVADTYISGLARVFQVEHVDPLYLWGLSVSAQDTAIVFPREFGVFARADLDHDLSTTLQAGLPDSTSAVVTVTAVDRNWVNWARGGNFNPSGQVRVPSVRGDGTGVFGSGVMRAFRVVATARPSNFRPCPPDVVL